jgi:hypothetical protein
MPTFLRNLAALFSAPFLSLDTLIRCVAETSKDDGNKQCADFVSVIVSVIVGQLDALVAFVRSEAPASNLISVTTTIRTQQVSFSTCFTTPNLQHLSKRNF